MNRFSAAWILVGMFAVQGSAGLNTQPAARVHVRYVDGAPKRFTSKLKKVIELNFTLGFNHSEGKPIIDQYLGRAAVDYAGAGKDSAFSIRKFIGPGNGTSVGLPNPVPTLADLLSGEVIVDNNISYMNQIPGKSAAFAKAFEDAVKINGRGVVGFHGSGDGEAGWTFYTNELHPVDYHTHGARIPAPVYVNDAEAKHIVNEGILTSGTQMSVPMGTDASGREVKKTVIVRQMTNEWYKFGRPLLTDPVTKDKATCFLRYDPATTDLEPQYRYPGGNPFAWQITIGKGKAFYMPPGHAADELTTGTSFDGGSGDLEKYYAQVLFYMAGYDTTACGATDCAGLPIVDDQNHLTGEKCCGWADMVRGSGSALPRNARKAPYQARLLDLRGREMGAWRGDGDPRLVLEKAALRPGIYFLKIRLGNGPASAVRILVPPMSP